MGWGGLGLESRGHKIRVAPVLMKHRLITRDGMIRRERAGSSGCVPAAARTAFQNPAWCSMSAWCSDSMCSLFPRLPLNGSSQTCALGSPDAPVDLHNPAFPAGRPHAHPSLSDTLNFPGLTYASPALGSLSPSQARINHILLLCDLCHDLEHSMFWVSTSLDYPVKA